MATTITAGNATNGAAISSDSTGILEFKTGTGSGTTALTLSTGQQAAYALGTAAAPSITFSGDTNTGIYSPAADTVAIGTGGVQRVTADSSGNLRLNTSTGELQLAVGAERTITPSGSSGSTSLTFKRWNGSAYVNDVVMDGSGNVGIGTSSPQSLGGGYTTVTINGTNGGGIWMSKAGTAYGYVYADSTGAVFQTPTTTPLIFQTNNTERARIGASGGLAIVNGLAVGTSTIFTSSIFFASAVLSAGAGSFPLRWNSSTGIVTYDTSSRFVKENIEDSPYGLAEVMQLQPRKYFRVDDQKFEIGFVADEIQPILPEFVPIIQKSTFTKNEEDIEAIAGGVNYEKLTAVLVKAIQELKAELDATKAEVAALKGAAQ
jgi:hypothetical protein